MSIALLFTGCQYGDRIEACGRYIRGLGRAYVCAKYSEYCCATCGVSSASIQEQGVITDPADKDKHTAKGKKKSPKGKGRKGKKRKGARKGKGGKRGKGNDNVQSKPKDLNFIGNLIRPEQKSQLADLFQKALNGLNQFLSNSAT